MTEWQKHAAYARYTEDSQQVGHGVQLSLPGIHLFEPWFARQIAWFWKYVRSLSMQQRTKLLYFRQAVLIPQPRGRL